MTPVIVQAGRPPTCRTMPSTNPSASHEPLARASVVEPPEVPGVNVPLVVGGTALGPGPAPPVIVKTLPP